MTFHHQGIQKHFGVLVYRVHLALQIWLIVYLHLLGAKTGLILLYGAFFYYWWRRYGRNTGKSPLLVGMGAIAGMALVAFLSIKSIPMLQNRIYYTLYDFNQYMHGAYIDGLTDGARVLSWNAGMDIARTSPWMGVGVGDMHHVFTDWHRQHSSHLQPYNWLQPSNEWLMYLCGSGIPGMLLLTIGLWLIYTRYPNHPSDLFNILFFSQFFMMWYEVNLTNQTAIAIFAFFMGWVHHRDAVEKDK
jgi:O-antigen ligase